MKFTIQQDGVVSPLTFTKNGNFGDFADINLPPDCECMVVCIDTMQHEPERVCLPHHVYRTWLEETFNRSDVRSITIIPVRVKEKITIERKW